MRKVLFVSGMHCEHCKKRVEAAIEGIDGAQATADLKKHSVEVRSDKDISDELLTEAVKQSGYTVTGIETAGKGLLRNPFRKG